MRYKKLITIEDLPEIYKHVDKKLISVQSHPEDENLKIFNYTKKCQFEQAWNDCTLQCRGLIIDEKEKKIIARPFSKFFNAGEIDLTIEEISNWKDKKIMEKYDGSLGILYKIGDKYQIATRGSFASEQSKWANEYMKDRGFKGPNHMFVGKASKSDDYTHLFEIICPESKVVVHYDFTGLVYIGSVHKETGEIVIDNDMIYFGENIPEKFHKNIVMNRENSEGYVVIKDNLLVKIKEDEYVRLHRILSGLSVKTIIENLRDNIDDTELIESLDEEHRDWYKKTKHELQMKKNFILSLCKPIVEGADYETRKEQAEYIQKSIDKKYWGICFATLDKRDTVVNNNIWKIISKEIKDADKTLVYE